MNWSEQIDAYCERTGPAFWAEPLNALSNLSFILAALYGLSLFRRAGGRDWALLALASTALAVGIGSFLFHTLATRWAALADVLPIAVFIAIGFGTVLHRLVGAGLIVSLVATVLFLVGSPTVAGLLEPLLGASSGYAPALLALLLIGGWLVARQVEGGAFVLAAGLLFAFSIAFRMMDLPLCERLPAGTHVFWHIFNGGVLALVLRAVVRPVRVA